MFAVISAEKIELPPGTVVRMLGTWQDYLTLNKQRGDGLMPRLKYRRSGEILLMSPLPIHGKYAHVLAHVATTLLDHSRQAHDAFTPITMTIPEESGLEPDYCFYIDNWKAVSGKARIDWQIDPPPDLVIEVDVTSYTDVNDYLPFKIPEVWLFKNKQLKVYEFSEGAYRLQTHSRFFPSINILETVAECIEITDKESGSAAIWALREKLERER